METVEDIKTAMNLKYGAKSVVVKSINPKMILYAEAKKRLRKTQSKHGTEGWKGELMNKRIIMLVLILSTLTGCQANRRPSVLVDTSAFRAFHRIDIGNKYKYVNFDVAKTDTGKDVIIHFERRTNEKSN